MSIIIILLIVVLLSIICGIVSPSLKRKRCTFLVNGTVTKRKAAGTSIGNGIDTEADRVTLQYFYNGKKYTKRINVEPDATMVTILVNPNKPNEFVQQSKRLYWLGIIMSIVVTIVALFYIGFIWINYL